jgi:GT2 family glycosyltransferase
MNAVQGVAVDDPVGRAAIEPVTVVYVAYGVTTLDVSWLDPDDTLIVVHNDELLPMGGIEHGHAVDVVSKGNVGFGAGVNAALDLVATERVILCNPDTQLTTEHRRLLGSTDPDELVTVPLDDDRGEPTWVVHPYPGPLAAVAMGYRLGRALGRRSRLRDLSSRLLTLGKPGYASLLGVDSGSWPLTTHWVSGAVLSMATERVRAIGGFDAGFFLYMEDVDLCQRLAARFPSMRVRLARSSPGRHAVGGSISAGRRRAIELARILSVRRYCSLQSGLGWRAVRAALCPRAWWLAIRTGGTR